MVLILLQVARASAVRDSGAFFEQDILIKEAQKRLESAQVAQITTINAEEGARSCMEAKVRQTDNSPTCKVKLILGV